VAGFRRAIALAIAGSGFLEITFLGVRDVASTTPNDARTALSYGAVAGFVAIVYAAASAGGDVARGGLALALLGGADRRRAVLDRLGAYACAGAVFALAGALTAAALTYVLLATAGGPTPGPSAFFARTGGTVIYGALMGALGAGLGLALRSAPAAVITTLVALLALDPLASGLLTQVARWGPGGVGGALTGTGADDLPPAWAAGLALLAYAAAVGGIAAALTARRDVP
jgi:hypothetical protein